MLSCEWLAGDKLWVGHLRYVRVGVNNLEAQAYRPCRDNCEHSLRLFALYRQSPCRKGTLNTFSRSKLLLETYLAIYLSGSREPVA